jgi:hypothetical protein
MSVLHSLIGRRHFLASTLVGTIGVFLPVTAAHAETTPRPRQVQKRWPRRPQLLAPTRP